MTRDLEAALREGAAYFDNPLEDAIAKCSMWVEGGGVEFDVKDCELILDELRRLRGGRLFYPAPSQSPNVVEVLRTKTCALNGALDAIIQLRARIAELKKERDSARAEGIAAMRECAVKIADRISTHPDPTWRQVAFLIANSIRGANL